MQEEITDKKTRIERDSLGEVEVPEKALRQAQTQRSLENFPQGVEKIPLSQIRALVLIKKAAAGVNLRAEKLDGERADLITKACDQVLAGGFEDQFPLTVRQTGSGTQTNMNVNEVLASLSNRLAGGKLIHPNDHVNMSQSSNDDFPTALHLATLLNLKEDLYPALDLMVGELERLEGENRDLIKTGRTHLQDATPVRVSQEISARKEMVKRDYRNIREASKDLCYLAIGGTAVGTGLNAPINFGKEMAGALSEMTGLELFSDENKFFQLSSKSSLVFCHGAIKTLATDLYKIASDIRLLSSGPRCGLGEYILPANEPGSSIMPGKVNPTQVESLTMVCLEVIANDLAISLANSQGQAQLNVYMPLISYKMTQSISLLSKSITCFSKKLLMGLKVNEKKIEENMDKSLMLVTALSPYIGYDKASKLAKNAHERGISLRESCLNLGYLSEEDFDKIVDPKKMV